MGIRNKGFADTDNRGERFVVDHHVLGGVYRFRLGFSHNRYHRLADKPDPIGGQRSPGRTLRDGRVLPVERTVDRISDVGRSDNVDNARHRPGLRNVDGTDQGMGMDRRDVVDGQHSRQVEVCHKRGLAGEQVRIFGSEHTGADERAWHLTHATWPALARPILA